MKLSDNLKRIRKENNLSQEQLAEKLGVSRQAVSKWESGQSYPEMEKVLLICKLFNYNMDELMNENVKEVNETKQSKINFNKYIEDFFSFITKTVDMLSSMTFKQKIKCLFEQFFVMIILFIIFFIIGIIGSHLFSSIFSAVNSDIYYTIRNIIEAIFTILGLVIGTTIFLHIFKIRYLDYYEIVKEKANIEDCNNDEKQIETTNENKEKKKVFIEKKKEKIIIRDPKHSQSKFLTGIMKIVLWFIKVIAICFSAPFIISFIGFVALLVLSFIFVKTGFLFVGCLSALISAIIINYVILELFYNFIVSRKLKKTRTSTLLLSSLVLAGLGIGLICIGITKFNYIENREIINNLEEGYSFQMNDNLYINSWNGNIQYVETDSNEIKISVKHSKYYKVDYFMENEGINLYYYQNEYEFMELIRDIIDDINNKEIKDYNVNPDVFIYTSKENIEKLKQSRENKYRQENEINNLYNNIEMQENRIFELENEIADKNILIESLEQQLYEQEIMMNEL